MGRGRQKAKHTKVARDLKYFSPNTNYEVLAQELAGSGNTRLAEDLEKWPEYVSGDLDDVDDEFEDEYDEEPKTA